MNTITISVRNVEKFREKFAQLVRKAEKLNQTPPVIISEHCSESVQKYNGVNYVFVDFEITIGFELLKIDGWKLLARVDGTENIIFNVPGEKLPKEQMHYTMLCEHCNLSRQRNNIFVLQSTKTGDFKRVGTSCLSDFLGIDSGAILVMSNFFYSIQELITDDYTSFTPSQYHLPFVLSVAKFVIDTEGYTSRENSEKWHKPATSATVNSILNNSRGDSELSRIISHTDSDFITNCIVWMKSNTGSNSSYLANLASIAENNFCTYKTLGYACSAITAYNKHLTDETTKKAQPSKSNFVGKVGDKFDSKSKLVAVCTKLSTPFTSDTPYGIIKKQYYTFTDSTGNEFSWCTESGKCKEGDRCTLTGKIIKHEVNRFTGAKQTVLSNCRLTVV